MILGIEALHINLEHITGIERYLLLALEALDTVNSTEKYIDKIIIFTKKPTAFGEYENITIQNWSINDEGLSMAVNRSGVDLLHCTFVPVEADVRCPVIYTLHDIGRYIYPEFMDRDLMKLHIDMLQKLLDEGKCTVTTVTKASKKQIEEILHLDEKIVYSARLYPSRDFKERLNKLKDNGLDKSIRDSETPFFLVVGCFIPTKNVVTIIRSFERVSQTKKYKDHKLIIVGKEGWDTEAEKLALKVKGVVRLKDVSDEQLLDLYKKCEAFISASLIEGFGLPVIEAASFGKTIICSDIPPYREILKNKGIFFEKGNVGDLTNKLMENDLREKDYSDVIEEFNAENMGKELINSYKETIKLIG